MEQQTKFVMKNEGYMSPREVIEVLEKVMPKVDGAFDNPVVKDMGAQAKTNARDEIYTSMYLIVEEGDQ